MSRTQRPSIAAILGPTASGKTALALAVRASGCPVEAVGCDALQLFSGLDAATAKPSADERAALPHHVVDCIAPTSRVDAGEYARLAGSAIDDISARGNWPLLVGGTGLYFRALVDGLSDIPKIDPAIRADLATRFDRDGPDAVYKQLTTLDPDYAATTPPTNRQRVLRALEVAIGTGISFTEHHRRHAGQPPRYRTLKIVLEPPRADHKARIITRAQAMVEPLLDECRKLLVAGITKQHHATQALGYRDALEMLETDSVDRERLRDELARAHVRYAKRQRTWFNRLDADIRIDAQDPTGPAVVAEVAEKLGEFFADG